MLKRLAELSDSTLPPDQSAVKLHHLGNPSEAAELDERRRRRFIEAGA
jgi:hypothetical protein